MPLVKFTAEVDSEIVKEFKVAAKSSRFSLSGAVEVALEEFIASRPIEAARQTRYMAKKARNEQENGSPGAPKSLKAGHQALQAAEEAAERLRRHLNGPKYSPLFREHRPGYDLPIPEGMRMPTKAEWEADDMNFSSIEDSISYEGVYRLTTFDESPD